MLFDIEILFPLQNQQVIVSKIKTLKISIFVLTAHRHIQS